MTDRPDNADLFASPEERRALSADELSLVDLARNPTLGKLSSSELADLIDRLRDQRDQSRDTAGSAARHDFLDAALKRAKAEQGQRKDKPATDAPASDAGGGKPSQHDLAQKATDMKTKGKGGPNTMAEDGAALHPNDPDASDGKADLEDTARRTAPSGALDHAGALPARKRSMNRR